MSLTSNATVVHQMLPAGNDPRMPAGIWYATALNQEGDASGGEHVLRAVLQVSSHPRLPRLYTLSKLTATYGAAAGADAAQLRMTGFTLNQFDLTSGVAATRSQSLPFYNDAAYSSMSIPGFPVGGQEYIIGYPVTGSQARIDVAMDNATSVSCSTYMQGYFYLDEAAYAPSGPLRLDDNPGNYQQLGYPAGRDSYYSQLRVGNQPQVRQPTMRGAGRVPATTPTNPPAAAEPEYTQDELRRMRQAAAAAQQARREAQAEREATAAGYASRTMNPPRRPTKLEQDEHAVVLGAVSPINATDRQLAQAIFDVSLVGGTSAQTASSIVLGQTPEQVTAQLNQSKGKKITPAPGAAYANIGGRWEE